MIHPTAIISSTAKIGKNVAIGPYCVIGDDVTIGDNCILHSHVVMEGVTVIGKHNTFYPFAAIGLQTQDLKYQGGPTYLSIGDHNTFRENVTVHRSTFADMVTTIGSHNNFLANTHVAHDCTIEDYVIFSNHASIAGHVHIASHVVLGGFTAVHQFVRIGKHTLTGGCTRVPKDILPFMLYEGSPCKARAINTIGMERQGYSVNNIKQLKRLFRKILTNKVKLSDIASGVAKEDVELTAEIQYVMDFINDSKRGISF